jgi:hypothetical protein
MQEDDGRRRFWEKEKLSWRQKRKKEIFMRLGRPDTGRRRRSATQSDGAQKLPAESPARATHLCCERAQDAANAQVANTPQKKKKNGERPQQMKDMKTYPHPTALVQPFGPPLLGAPAA